MRLLVVLLAVALASCSTLRTDLEENCEGANSTCPLDLAEHATLQTLERNGENFIVECETSFHPLDERYRSTCHKKVEALAKILSSRGKGRLLPITASDIRFADVQGCIDTTGGALDTFGIKATIPLRWLGK